MIKNRKLNRERGMALPIVLVMMVSLVLIAGGLLLWFNGSGVKQIVQMQSAAPRIGAAYSGVSIAKHMLQSPADPGSAHHWTDGQTTTKQISIGDKSVTVQIQDTTLPD
jgi:hypothetical protein